MRFIRQTVTSLLHALFSWRFLLSVLGVSAIIFVSSSGHMEPGLSVWYYIMLATAGSGAVILAFCIFPVIPYGAAFSSEWQQKAVNFWLIRSGVKQYSWNKLLVSAITGFLTVFLGMLLFAGVLSCFYPPYTHSVFANAYEVLLDDGHIVGFFLLYATHFGFSGMLMACCGYTISTFFPNRLIAVVGPFILHFTVIRIVYNIPLPQALFPFNWVEGVYSAGTPLTTILVKACTILVLCAFLGVLASDQLNRRIQHA